MFISITYPHQFVFFYQHYLRGNTCDRTYTQSLFPHFLHRLCRLLAWFYLTAFPSNPKGSDREQAVVVSLSWFLLLRGVAFEGAE